MRTAALFVLAILFPAFAHAATLVNINTADAAALVKALAGTGIGSAKATAIIDYRNANGPFAHIQDIQNVKGIGNGVTYANIAPFITVGNTRVSDVSNVTSDETASSTVSDSSEDTTIYIPPPSALTLDAGTDRSAVMEVPLHLYARAVIKGGAVDSSAQIVWGFGDASSAEGSAVEKTYRYAGTYLVVVTATDGQATGRDEFIVTVRPAQVRILEVPDTGIMVINDTNERLDLSGWALFADKSSFRVPNGTVLLPRANVLFSSVITKLPMAPEVTLAYPSGGIATRYTVPSESVVAIASMSTPDAPALPADRQPSLSAASYEQVQAARLGEAPARQVEPIISTKANIQTHEEAVSAPAVANELAAAGAASDAKSPSPASRAAGIFKSPWALSFLGVVVLAGSAFIFL